MSSVIVAAWISSMGFAACSKSEDATDGDTHEAGTREAGACLRRGTACAFYGRDPTEGTDCCSGECVDRKCSCMAPGAPCDEAHGGISACCAGICTAGVCACGGPGGTCTKDRDCCEGECLGGQCTRLPAGGACTSKDACVSGTCEFGGCKCRTIVGSSGLPECCSDVGASCGAADAGPPCCASGSTCTTSTCACVLGGKACRANEDCCADHLCGRGRCCVPPGAACSVSEPCCNGDCMSGTCPNVPACIGKDNPCTTSKSCCSGNCEFRPLRGGTVCD